ncbi:MAG TPA: hypothetical protein VHI13_02805, partial [Candidatus Kapabacteria bacterium]|nr:hypothetical protein [Candidatus Kapabacteria bacterium]
MAILAQLSQIDSTRGQGALAIMLSDDPFIRHLEQVSGWEEDATDFDYPTVDGDSDVQTRARGGQYESDGEVPVPRISGSLAFHGDSFTVDRSDLADASRGLRDLPKWIEGKITKKVKKWSRKFSVKLWQGSGADGNIKGLVNVVDGATDLPGYTGYKGVIDARDYTAGADYLDLTNKDNWGAFYRLVIQAVSEVENPTGMSMNKELFGLVQ